MIRPSAMICLLLLGLAGPLAASTDLPSMGEPVDQVLSPRQEAEIGRELMARARRSLDLNADPEIATYIDQLGQRIAAHSEATPVDGYTFFVVRNPSINAFAGPGGYIGVHSGLVLEATTEAQLAGVIAHEIAHVSQRHIARAYARNQRGSYTTMAAILAGLIIGSQNPQAGQAAITGGIAAEQQRQINYTRSNEYEADRIGIGLLARAGYAPRGMTEFFETLQRKSGPGSSSVPEFLRTHPLSQNRVAEAASRADSLSEESQRVDSLAFHLMRMRMAALYTDQPGQLHDRWRQEAAADNELASQALGYGLAVLELRMDRARQAHERLAALQADAPDNLHYGLAVARAAQLMGDGQRALASWEETRALYPGTWPTIATGARLLLDNGRADQAIATVTEFIRGDGPVPPEAWRTLAEAADAAGRPVRSHEALAEYYVRISRLDQALLQLELALEGAAAESPERIRLQTRIEQVKELRRERLARNPIGG